MSVLLHGISFPPEGEDAIGLFLHWDRTVHLWRPRAFVGNDVEATELPPHGRLIDADEMKESIRKQTAFLKLIGGEFAEIAEIIEKGFLQEIDNAPTIIEAEKEST